MSRDFDGQREDEKVLFVFRRNLVVTWRGFLWFLILLALGIGAMVIWPNNGAITVVFLVLMLLGVVVYGYTYILWYFTVYIVTNMRIRVVLQKGLFKQKVTDLGLEKIESVTMDTAGIMAHLLGYGTILVQTVVGDLTISSVSRPKSVYNKLQDAVDNFKGPKNEQN